MKTKSTAAAARELLDSPSDCAAICSSICAELFPGLEILFAGIQNERCKHRKFLNLFFLYLFDSQFHTILCNCLLTPGQPTPFPYHRLRNEGTTQDNSMFEIVIRLSSRYYSFSYGPKHYHRSNRPTTVCGQRSLL